MRVSIGYFRTIIITALLLATTACGFRLRDNYNFPDEIKTLSVTSFDTYGHLSRELKNRLRINQVELTTPTAETANLHLKSEVYEENTLSLYQTATVAQRQFTYTVKYAVTIPNKGSYNFSIALNRSYLDNPLTALAKSVEEEMLVQEMRIEATRQIMRQLGQLTANIEEFDRQQAAEKILEKMNSQQNDENLTIETHFEGKETKAKPLSSYMKSRS